jgi:hypothetical protein
MPSLADNRPFCGLTATPSARLPRSPRISLRWRWGCHRSPCRSRTLPVGRYCFSSKAGVATCRRAPSTFTRKRYWFALQRAHHDDLVQGASLVRPGGLPADGETSEFVGAPRCLVVDHNRERQLTATALGCPYRTGLAQPTRGTTAPSFGCDPHRMEHRRARRVAVKTDQRQPEPPAVICNEHKRALRRPILGLRGPPPPPLRWLTGIFGVRGGERFRVGGK